MKTKIFSALVLGAILLAFSACDKKNEVTTDKQNEKNGHEYVDLGLPSGTLWATCNVGATKPELAGYFFAWGETEPKNQFFEENYKWSNFEKYNEKDGKTQLDPEDDAATKNWGEPWRMPTRDDCQELISNCNWKWTEINGYAGCLGTSKANGNTIFIPAAGESYRGKELSVGETVMFWSSTLNYDLARIFCMDNKDEAPIIASGSRSAGFSVRPVRSK